MEILPNMRIVDKGIFLIKKEALIISDLQLGFEETLRQKGIMIPRYQFSDIMQDLSALLEKTKPKKIILNGDIKHEFGTIVRTEWKQVSELLEYLKQKCEVAIIKGNHDTLLGPITRKIGIPLLDHLFIDDTYACHGHAIPIDEDFKRSRIVIIGHEHPAIGLTDSSRIEKFKCFLKGTFEDKTLIVLPSFNPVTEGTDILREKRLSPFLGNISDFEAYVVSKDILSFGKIKDILKYQL